MPTAYRGSEEEVRGLNAYIKLMRAADSVTARVHRHLAAHNLTVGQFGVLEALLHKGSLCQRDLCGKILKSGGNVTLIIDNLEKRGLVRRERSEADRRYVTVHLTDEGREAVVRLFPEHLRAILAEMTTLTPAEQDELGRLCRKLGTREAGPPDERSSP